MPTTPLFPLPEGLEITSMSETPEELLVGVTSHRQTSCCPTCSTPSSAIPSYYRRKPRDLPCVGRPIHLLLTVRKFICRTPHCSRKVFTERLPDFIEASSRLTTRLRTAVQEIGFARLWAKAENVWVTSWGCLFQMPACCGLSFWSLCDASWPGTSHRGGRLELAPRQALRQYSRESGDPQNCGSASRWRSGEREAMVAGSSYSNPLCRR